MGALLDSIAGPVGGAVQALVGGVTSAINTNKTNKANRELAEYQYSKDLEMWNRGNAYNSPTAQMERLKKAGLNPNLVYGSGATGNTAGQLPKYNAPTMSYNYTPPVDIPGMIGMFQDIQLKNAQIRNQQAEADYRPEMLAGKLQGLGISNYWKDNISQNKERMDRIKANMMGNTFEQQIGGKPTPFQEYSLEAMKAGNASKWASMNKMIQDTEYKRIQTDWLTGNAIMGIAGKATQIFKSLTGGAKGVQGSLRQGKTISQGERSWSGKKYTEAQQTWNRRRTLEGFYD